MDAARTRALAELKILDSPPEAEFDDIVHEVAEVSRAPIALISLVDEHRQWFKARLGLDVCETAREHAFCSHAIAGDGPFLVSDALADLRFRDNPLVVGSPGIRSYAGAPIVTSGGWRIGTVCAIDHQPRDWDAQAIRTLERLARVTARLIEMRARCALADEQAQRLLALHAEDVEYRTIFAAMREGVVLQDRASVILRHNPGAATLLGLTREQLLGRSSMHPDWRLVDADGAALPVEAQPSMRCLATGEPVLDVVLGVNLPDASRRWLSVNSLPIFERPDEPPTQTVTSFIDVTELKAKEAELRATLALAERASLAKSQFVANVSHEIRTPLNGIIALAGALQDTDLTVRQREMVDIIVSSGTTLEAILNDLLDISKIEAERMEVEVAAFDIRDLVQAATDLFQIRADDKGIGFSVQLRAPVGERYLGDAQKIRQILWNLVANAIKFTDVGEVAMSVDVIDPADGTARRDLIIEVRDTGIGVEPDVLPCLFEPFVQADESFTRRFGGTGLGLAICRSLAHLLGGEISAVSAPGHGSAFTVKLPLDATDAEPSLADTQDTSVEAGLRILVVEDNANNRRVVELLLEPIGADLAMAENGAEALDLFDARPFDLILMDMQMPVMDGLSATREIRRREALSGARPTPIAMMTANAASEHRAAAAEAGADGFITKPVTPAALYAGIQGVIT